MARDFDKQGKRRGRARLLDDDQIADAVRQPLNPMRHVVWVFIGEIRAGVCSVYRDLRIAGGGVHRHEHERAPLFADDKLGIFVGIERTCDLHQ